MPVASGKMLTLCQMTRLQMPQCLMPFAQVALKIYKCRRTDYSRSPSKCQQELTMVVKISTMLPGKVPEKMVSQFWAHGAVHSAECSTRGVVVVALCRLSLAR
mmetsp:Transcript_116759/g.341842  ORF Transcript_116759/g.341842 Transcript_116759/m.341842 type:complete len:103 (+) Transcript_116759:273-581(+)